MNAGVHTIGTAIAFTPRSNEPGLNGGDDALILMEDGSQLVDVLQHHVLLGVTVGV